MTAVSNGLLAEQQCRRTGPATGGGAVLDDIASVTLQTAISGLGLRQQVTANNIANLETPGFSAGRVDFENSLADALATGDPTHAAITTRNSGDAAGANGNNVNLDDEFVLATKTGLQEKLLTGELTAKYGLISTVLKG
jgi:flagellar basal-body rod protein FlgB